MWIENIGELENIKTAVYYSCSKENYRFFPIYLKDGLKNASVAEVLANEVKTLNSTSLQDTVRKSNDTAHPTVFRYRGSSTSNLHRDWIEYGMHHQINKDRFNNKFITELFDNDTLNLIGKSPESLSKLESCVFPTDSDNSRDRSSYVGFFGVTNISGNTVYTLEYKYNDCMIELYNEVLEEGDLEYSYQYRKYVLGKDKGPIPALVIHLGPNPCLRNNLSDYYFPSDPYISSYGADENNKLEYENYYREKIINIERNIKKYSSALDELTNDGLIFLSISSNNLGSVNLSYDSWVNNDNSNRNQPYYTLRNNDFYATRYNQEVTYGKSDGNINLNSFDEIYRKQNNYPVIWSDVKSNSIIGTKLQINTPILSRKLKNLELSKVDGYYKFSISAEYRKRDEIWYKNQIWVSTSNGNKGNWPEISNKWIPKESYIAGLNERIFVITECYNEITRKWERDRDCGETTTAGEISVDKLAEEIQFKVNCNPGYKVDSKPIWYISDTGEIKPVSNIYYDFEKNIAVIKNWDNILKSKNQTIIIRFKKSEVKVSLNARIEYNGQLGPVIPYSDWDSGLMYNLKSITIKNEVMEGNYIKGLVANNEHVFEFIPNKKYKIKEVIISTPDSKKTIKESISNTSETLSFSDNLDYSEAEYTVIFEPYINQVVLFDAEKLELSKNNVILTYGEDCEISWYSKSSNQSLFFGFRAIITEDESKLVRENISDSDGILLETTADIEKLSVLASLVFNETSGITTLTLQDVEKNVILFGFEIK